MTTYDNYQVEGDLAYKTLSVCQFLHISRRTLYRWIKSGKINANKMDGDWIISLEEINRVRGLRGLKFLSIEESLELFEVFNA